MLVHSCVPNYRVLEVTQRLDTYSHDPEPPQDPIQIGDHTCIFDGPRRGLVGKIIWIDLLILWVEPLLEPVNLPQEDDIPDAEGSGPCWMHIHRDEAETQPPSTLMFSSQYGYDVTVGDSVQVMRGKYCSEMGIVLNVNFRKASMEIRCEDFTVCVQVPLFCYFLTNTCSSTFV